MTKTEIINNIYYKKSFLCIGLDTDLSKIPPHFLKAEDPIFEFNKQIIDATQQYCVAFKPNTAFYECYGVKGWISLQKTIQYIKKTYPNQFVIADAKRGDIGNTSTMYAKAFFKELNADAVTVAPYMGKDSVEPFLKFDGKWAIILALTSNDGSKDFQTTPIPVFKNEEKLEIELLAEQVLKKTAKWGTADNTMYVIGATRAQLLKAVRSVVPNHFFLVPGVGAQGGSLKEVVENGMNKEIGLLVNSSRSILYASDGLNFAEEAAKEAKKLQQEMAFYL